MAQTKLNIEQLEGVEELTNKATSLTSPDNTKYPTTLAVDTALGTKQDTLVSGTNIKTINGASVLGSGDLVVGSDLVWTYFDQTETIHTGTVTKTILRSIEMPSAFLSEGFLEIQVFVRKLASSTNLHQLHLNVSGTLNTLGTDISVNTSGTLATVLNYTAKKILFFNGSSSVYNSPTIEGNIPEAKINFGGGNNYTVQRNNSLTMASNRFMNVTITLPNTTESSVIEAVSIKIYN